LDLVYPPRLTRLLADAAAAGSAATMNGEVMLLHQGAAAFELWTGQAAPLDLMRAQLEAGLAADAGGLDEAAVGELDESAAAASATTGDSA